MRVSEIGETDLYIRCPCCRRTTFHLGYNLRLARPADEMLLHYVTRHVCRRCSRPGRKIRCEGLLQDPPRSGAEPRGTEGAYPW